jgi:hypothetical protein
MLIHEMFSDPAATADPIFRSVDADDPPLHLVLGAAATFFILLVYHLCVTPEETQPLLCWVSSAYDRSYANAPVARLMQSRDVLHDHFPNIVPPAVQHRLGAVHRHANDSLR